MCMYILSLSNVVQRLQIPLHARMETHKFGNNAKAILKRCKGKKNLSISSIKTEFIMLFFGKCCSCIVRRHTSKKNIYCLIGQRGTSSRSERLTILGNLAVDVFGRGKRHTSPSPASPTKHSEYQPDKGSAESTLEERRQLTCHNRR